MIEITDAELLNFDQSFIELGEIFTFRKEKSYSVKGRLKDYDNFAGVSGIQELISSQKEEWQDHQEIFLNGESFGSGIITDIEYNPNVDVRQKPFSISFVVSESVDLYNAYGEYYSGVSGIQAEDTKYLKSLSQNHSFENNGDETFSYSQNMSMSMESGLNSDPTQTAKNIATIVFNELNISDLNVFYPNYFESGNRIFQESYDLEGLEYSFSEAFDFQSGDPFIWKYNHTLSKSDNSIIISENGSISAAATPKSTAAQLGINDKLQATFQRCNNIYNEYSFSDNNGCDLINSPINKTVSFNQFDGSAAYSIQYSNDENIGTGCITELSYNINSSQNDSFQIIESVAIQGLGKRTYPNNQKYNNAKNCYENILANSGVRISGIVSGIETNCCSGFIPISLSIKDSESQGNIQYTRSYSCDDKYKVDSPFTERTCQISIDEGVPLHQTFSIIGQGEEIVGGCKFGNTSLSQINNNISVTATGAQSISGFLNSAYQCVTKPNDDTCGFINTANYSYSSKQNVFQLRIGYNFVKHKDLKDISIG